MIKVKRLFDTLSSRLSNLIGEHLLIQLKFDDRVKNIVRLILISYIINIL